MAERRWTIRKAIGQPASGSMVIRHCARPFDSKLASIVGPDTGAVEVVPAADLELMDRAHADAMKVADNLAGDLEKAVECLKRVLAIYEDSSLSNAAAQDKTASEVRDTLRELGEAK